MANSLADREDKLAEYAFNSLRNAIDEQPGRRAYVLIDPAFADPLADEIRGSTVIGDRARTRLIIDIMPPHQQPYLLELTDDVSGARLLSAATQVAIRERLGEFDNEAGEVRSVCGWLLANGDGETAITIARRMAHACWVRLPLNRERTVFRYWDPRLTVHLPRVFGSDVWTGTISDIGLLAWWCLDDDGTPKGYTAATQSRAPSAESPAWQIDDDQWFALARIGWTKRACQLLPQWEVPEGIGGETVRSIVERTARYHLRTEGDVLRFVHCALALHPRFDSHPQVAAALAELQAQGSQAGAFVRVAQQWTDQFRAALVEGKWLSDPAGAGTVATKEMAQR
jgi:hypothetical protein